MAVVGLLLTGCSAAVDLEPLEPTAVEVVTPGQGRSLASLGFECPVAESVWLPGGTVLTYTADQPNVVIVAGQAEQAESVQEYLRETLPGLGWRITSESEGGLLFENDEWHGAYALGEDSWALTARND